MEDYYSFPFNPLNLFRNQLDLLYSDLKKSIQQHLSLIISTRFEEFRFDPDFGCEIWEIDFVLLGNEQLWKNEIKTRLENAIATHEHRIERIIEFDMDFSQMVKKGIKNNYQQLDIRLLMEIKGTREAVTFKQTLIFSPYSVV